MSVVALLRTKIRLWGEERKGLEQRQFAADAPSTVRLCSAHLNLSTDIGDYTVLTLKAQWPAPVLCFYARCCCSLWLRQGESMPILASLAA